MPRPAWVEFFERHENDEIPLEFCGDRWGRVTVGELYELFAARYTAELADEKAANGEVH